jgi:adenylate cyclase
MKPNTTINEIILNEEIEKERLRNGFTLCRIRVLTVSIFFFLHIMMGYGFGKDKFKGKEIIFFSYLIIALVLIYLPFAKKYVKSIREFSIPLLDIPMTYLIFNAWILSIDEEPVFRILGVLALAFMIFFTNLSGLFFSGKVTVPVTLAAIASVIPLFLLTKTPDDTIVTGVLLLVMTGYSSYRISRRVKSLVSNAAQKQSLNEKLSRYFAPEVAIAIENKQQSQQRIFDVTVLFTDIRDFTKMSSTMDGEHVISMLNEIHEHLVSCIFLTGGTLDKYLGDGVMAYFGAPVVNENHADRALECAVMMRSQIEEYNRKRTARGEKPIQIGIGLHSGPAIIGDIGAEIRREFTIIGDTVNTASRLEGLTKVHKIDILLSSATRDRLRESGQLRSLGFDEIRGSGVRIETFTL